MWQTRSMYHVVNGLSENTTQKQVCFPAFCVSWLQCHLYATRLLSFLTIFISIPQTTENFPFPSILAWHALTNKVEYQDDN